MPGKIAKARAGVQLFGFAALGEAAIATKLVVSKQSVPQSARSTAPASNTLVFGGT